MRLREGEWWQEGEDFFEEFLKLAHVLCVASYLVARILEKISMYGRKLLRFGVLIRINYGRKIVHVAHHDWSANICFHNLPEA